MRVFPTTPNVLTVILEMKPFQERAIRLPVDIPFKANLLSRSKRKDIQKSSKIPLQFFSTSILLRKKKETKLEKMLDEKLFL
jgi:hypothetical protein